MEFNKYYIPSKFRWQSADPLSSFSNLSVQKSESRQEYNLSDFFNVDDNQYSLDALDIHTDKETSDKIDLALSSTKSRRKRMATTKQTKTVVMNKRVKSEKEEKEDNISNLNDGMEALNVQNGMEELYSDKKWESNYIESSRFSSDSKYDRYVLRAPTDEKWTLLSYHNMMYCYLSNENGRLYAFTRRQNKPMYLQALTKILYQ
jgi:hypothetical protein